MKAIGFQSDLSDGKTLVPAECGLQEAQDKGSQMDLTADWRISRMRKEAQNIYVFIRFIREIRG